MNKRNNHWLAIAGAWVSLLLMPTAAFAQSAGVQPPNIVLVLADDLGFADLGSYGSEIQTPNIDQLAASGLRFSNFHVAASCAPTRAMLMTGLDSHSVGVANIPEAIPEDQAHAPAYQGVLDTDVPTVAEMLRQAGYRTLMSGKWHLGMANGERPSQRGFDRTFMLADTGADNWRQRSYLPIYAEANWFEDGESYELARKTFTHLSTWWIKPLSRSAASLSNRFLLIWRFRRCIFPCRLRQNSATSTCKPM
jgi:arylsulfatase A-like enzyme